MIQTQFVASDAKFRGWICSNIIFYTFHLSPAWNTNLDPEFTYEDIHKTHFTIQYKDTHPDFEVANSGFREDMQTFVRHLEITVTHWPKLWSLCSHTKRYLKTLKAGQSHPRLKILQRHQLTMPV